MTDNTLLCLFFDGSKPDAKLFPLTVFVFITARVFELYKEKMFFFQHFQNRTGGGGGTLAYIQEPISCFWSEGQSSHLQGNQISIN